jgi:acetolactate decarboxylase
MKCEGDKMYDEPGNCPVCNMKLQEVQPKAESESQDRASDDTVKIAGAMMNVMHKGELYGTISLDTISEKTHLYGIGPVEYLTGEIMIMDGRSYKSTVISPSAQNVEETFNLKAPFFVYANVNSWHEVSLPKNVSNIKQLETFLNRTTRNHRRPFAFKLNGAVTKAVIHVVNLPEGSKVNSPEDAHKNEQRYVLHNREVDLVGFFSTEHQGVFTHHDTFVHIHLLTSDKKMMGHLDEVQFAKGKIKLYLPER